MVESERKPRILIVEDHPIIAELVETRLRIEGMEPIKCPGGREALELIGTEPLDAVILDIRMPPGVGGFDALRTINERNLVPVVIMLTAFPSEEYRQKSMDLGAQYFFDKSGDFKKMLSVIKDLEERLRLRSLHS